MAGLFCGGQKGKGSDSAACTWFANKRKKKKNFISGRVHICILQEI